MTVMFALDALMSLVRQIETSLDERDYPTTGDAAGLTLLCEAVENVCERFSTLSLGVA